MTGKGRRETPEIVLGTGRPEVLGFGAECIGDAVRFRLWAPSPKTVDLVLASTPDKPLPMVRGAGGWFELITRNARAGSRYHYRIDGGLLVPDPASRFQPDDVHGPSEVIDPASFVWTDENWCGRPWEEAVVYELHIGTFSPEGTYQGAARLLPRLADLGVTAIELMPLADFPGRRNWGYDGVLPFAPDSVYGRPEDLKSLIQVAHGLGLMVFIDVVYNHFGPDGNYIAQYAPQFFTDRHKTPWGQAINFDGEGSREVRAYFRANARYWLSEYHCDGLRFDAIHAIVDDSRPHIVQELALAVYDLRADGRFIHLILENEENTASYLQRDGERGVHTAQWNDDIHHVLHRLLTDEASGYYADYATGACGLLGRCLTEGFAYQGERSSYRGTARGQDSKGLPLTAFVSFLQNHDQIGNRAFGERITELASPLRVRSAMAILLLAPSPPLLFMGQEFGCARPFLFFCDFGAELAQLVTEGRRREFARFPEFSDPKRRARIPDPHHDATFEASRLDWGAAETSEGLAWFQFYKNILMCRRQRVVPHLKAGGIWARDYRVLGDGGLRARWAFADGAELVLMTNVGCTPMRCEPEVGAPIYTEPGESGTYPLDELGPWAVRWYLSEVRT